MSDDLFQYFNKSSSRKFEPIDDPDFDALDDEPTEQSVPADPSAGGDKPSLTAASNDLGGSQPTGESSAPSPASDSSAEEPPAKKGESHWDFLAGLLGIKKSAPAAAEQKTAAGKPTPSIKPARSTPTKAADPLEELFQPDQPAERVELFGDTPPEPSISSQWKVPAASADPLGELFDAQSAEPSVSDDDWEDDSDASSEDGEFLEFEIEEWDSIGSESPSGSRRRPPRRPESEPQAPPRDRESSGSSGRGNDRSRRSESPRQGDSRRSEGRQRDSRYEGGRKDRDDRRSGMEKNANRPDSRSRHPAREEKQPAVPPPPTRSDFGSGLFEDEPSFDARTEPSQPDSKSRKRRRRRGGQSSREDSSERREEVKGFVPEIENDPPDDFFDEIGWNPQTSSARRSTQDRLREEFDPVDEDDLVSGRGEAFSEDDSELAEREPRKRKRRRRRGKKDRDLSPDSVASTSDLSDDDFLDEIPVFDAPPPRSDQAKSSRNHRQRKDRESRSGSRSESFVESEKSPYRESSRDFSQESSFKDSRKGPQGRSPSDLADDFEDGETEDGKKAKFPTWDEAISGLVQSNIKNHSRHNRGGRSSGGGRRHR